jgi:hypothetical protein
LRGSHRVSIHDILRSTFHVKHIRVQSQRAKTPLMTPTDTRKTITHAPMTPSEMEAIAAGFFIRAISATKQPVYAPVPGNGIATKIAAQ